MGKKISLLGLTKDIKMAYLDNFLTDYEWGVFEDTSNKGKYVIYDLQCGCNVEENYTIEQVIKRVVSRALDYETDEHYDIFFEDFDMYNHKGYIDYLNGLYEIGRKYVDKNEENWFLNVGKRIREMTRYFEDINR